MQIAAPVLASLILTFSQHELDTNIWSEISVVEWTAVSSTVVPDHLVAIAVLDGLLLR